MLRNLESLVQSTERHINEELTSIGDLQFSDRFKSLFANRISSETKFFSSSAIYDTPTKRVVIPSIWFYVGALLVPLLQELLSYKQAVMEILNDTQIVPESEFLKWTEDLKNGQIELPTRFYETAVQRYGQEDADLIKSFLTDYKSWGGGKAIGRAQDDFHHSALLKASGLLNESSGFISVTTRWMMDHPELKVEIILAAERSKGLRSTAIGGERFDLRDLVRSLEDAQLKLPNKIVNRLSASLLSKPFLILTGLSGSGKTKLAQAFAQWLSASTEQYLVVPVGADWTSREPMFGYPSALNPTKYVQPDSGVLKLLLHAKDHPVLPHFLILDEMNMSHVERYFADFLSGIESGEELPLHSNSSELEGVPAKLRLPKNLFIIGTVNIDETTYMFSPKVLDRANVIEFRVSREEMGGFLANPVKPDLDRLKSLGASMGADFVVKAAVPTPYSEKDDLNSALLLFFAELTKCGAEFGYRSANEIHGLAGKLNLLNADISLNEVVDIALMQKLLPKVHGSRKKMEKILKVLAGLCTTDSATAKALLEKDEFNLPDTGVKYPMALEKLWRMYRGAVENGFTSYAEA